MTRRFSEGKRVEAIDRLDPFGLSEPGSTFRHPNPTAEGFSVLFLVGW